MARSSCVPPASRAKSGEVPTVRRAVIAYLPGTMGAAMKRMISGAAVVAALATVVVGFGARRDAIAVPSKKAIDPEADRLLRQMTDYLASLQSFRVQSSAVDEVVLKSGQKIQLASESQVSVQRPNRLRSEQLGARNGLAFWYDGKSMTLACKANDTYATVPAPATLDATIDKARKEFQIEAPGADLLYSRPYDILTEQVTGGQVIGRETVDGVPANHLAFTGEEVDWQVWIQDGAEPLPLRYSITTKGMKSQPEFTARLSNWETKARLEPSTFAFQAPAGATRAQSFPRSCSPGQTR